MPRALRVQIEGGLGHAYNRFARGEEAYADPSEAVEFIELLRGLKERGDNPEVVVPSDVTNICAYDPDGTHLGAGGAYTARNWGEVPVRVNEAYDLQGWGPCDSAPIESWRTNFAEGPAIVADLDDDGRDEVMVATWTEHVRGRIRGGRHDTVVSNRSIIGST